MRLSSYTEAKAILYSSNTFEFSHANAFSCFSRSISSSSYQSLRQLHLHDMTNETWFESFNAATQDWDRLWRFLASDLAQVTWLRFETNYYPHSWTIEGMKVECDLRESEKDTSLPAWSWRWLKAPVDAFRDLRIREMASQSRSGRLPQRTVQIVSHNRCAFNNPTCHAEGSRLIDLSEAIMTPGKSEEEEQILVHLDRFVRDESQSTAKNLVQSYWERWARDF